LIEYREQEQAYRFSSSIQLLTIAIDADPKNNPTREYRLPVRCAM